MSEEVCKALVAWLEQQIKLYDNQHIEWWLAHKAAFSDVLKWLDEFAPTRHPVATAYADLPEGYQTHGHILDLARKDAYNDWSAWKNEWHPNGDHAITHLRMRAKRGALTESLWAAQYIETYVAAWEEFDAGLGPLLDAPVREAGLG